MTYTYLWFSNHFDLVGEREPNGPGGPETVQIDKVEKKDLYAIYCQEVSEDARLNFSQWASFWKTTFPNVTMRKWKNVSGKCNHCALINNGRLTANCRAKVVAFRQLHLMHKAGFYMPERRIYHSTREKARNDPTMLSIIVDTMDNSHCSIPYLGPSATFSSPIHQGILGCLEHGTNTFTIYRTTGMTIAAPDYYIQQIFNRITKIIGIANLFRIGS